MRLHTTITERTVVYCLSEPFLGSRHNGEDLQHSTPLLPRCPATGERAGRRILGALGGGLVGRAGAEQMDSVVSVRNGGSRKKCGEINT